jgi:hypothetical protein
MDIVIEYDPGQSQYKIYEPTTDTLLVSQNITEGLVSLDTFLRGQGHIGQDQSIIGAQDIEYHLDSATMKAMIESNVNLLKRLRTGPSEFKNSSNKFGMSSAGMISQPMSGSKQQTSSAPKSSDFGRGNKSFAKSQFSGQGKDSSFYKSGKRFFSGKGR